MPEVLLINIHGGFPSAMTKRMTEELDAFRELAATSAFYERAYPTHACAGPALHDIVMDAPLGTMTDNVWHGWSHRKTASRTLFHVFQQHGYRTRLFGMFGLDRRLDPHVHMHVEHAKLQHALQVYGVDECDLQDAAFTCQLGLAHDRDAFDRVEAMLRDASRPPHTLTMVNLLGCQDVHKCSFHDMDPHRNVIPPMKFERGQYDDRIFSASVIDDDSRQTGTGAHSIPALHRASRLHDWIRGLDGAGLSREDVVRTTTGLHRFCWKCLEQLDEGLARIVQALREIGRLDDAIIYVFSDHPISLYEHGEYSDAPWDSCLRSFLLRRGPRAQACRVDTPLSLADLPRMLFDDCHLSCDWHVARALPDATLTLGIAVSWLARAGVAPRCDSLALRTFFVRCTVAYNDRVYAIVFWFSLLDMAAASSYTTERPAPVLSRIYEKQTSWTNPVLTLSMHDFAARGALQVYDHSNDRNELHNIAVERTSWCASAAASSIKVRADEAIRHHRLEELLLTVPENVHAITPERVSVCSVQLYNRVRETIHPLASASSVAPPIPQPRLFVDANTQTEDVSLMKALNAAFGVEVSSAISSLVAVAEGPLTVFAPDGLNADAQLPSWVPPPLRGAYERDALLDAADRGVPLTDAAKGDAHTLTRADTSSSVMLRRCRILLHSATSLVYSGGFILGYRVHEAPVEYSDTLQLVDGTSDAKSVKSDDVDGAHDATSVASFVQDDKRKAMRSRQHVHTPRARISTTRVDAPGSSNLHQPLVRGSVKAKEAGQNARHRR